MADENVDVSNIDPSEPRAALDMFHVSLGQPQPSDPELVAQVTECDVEPLSGPCSFFCNMCNAMNATKRCGACGAVVYCSASCQREAWHVHKQFCKRIRASTKLTRKLAVPLRNYSQMGEPARNAFEYDIGDFWGLHDPRPYCRARADLAFHLKDSSDAENNPLAAELAIQHFRQLMILSKGDNQGVRDFVPTMLIDLGRYQEAYDFIRYWIIGFSESYDDEQTTGHDMAEDLEVLKFSEYGPNSFIFALALLKYVMYARTRAAEMLIMRHPKVNPDIAKYAMTFAVPETWSRAGSQTLEVQLKQVLSALLVSNKHLLKMLVEAEKHRERPVGPYSLGDESEAWYLISSNLVPWLKAAGAREYVRRFLADDLRVPIPISEAEKKRRAMEKAKLLNKSFARSMRSKRDDRTGRL
uniref:MYND-type domain-containing protein n=1 Tax=Pinguiococcus pyrenoidosus TaxID=172671 RepID=A0A7R9U7V5_9STRA